MCKKQCHTFLSKVSNKVSNLFKKNPTFQFVVHHPCHKEMLISGEEWWAEWNRGPIDVPSSIKVKFRVIKHNKKQYLVTNKEERFFFFIKFNYGGLCAVLPDKYVLDYDKMSDTEKKEKVFSFIADMERNIKYGLTYKGKVDALIWYDHIRSKEILEDCSLYE